MIKLLSKSEGNDDDDKQLVTRKNSGIVNLVSHKPWDSNRLLP